MAPFDNLEKALLRMSEFWERSPLGGFSERLVGKRDACAPGKDAMQLKPAIND